MNTYNAYLVDKLNPLYNDPKQIIGENWDTAAKKYMNEYREKGDPKPVISKHKTKDGGFFKICEVPGVDFVIITKFKRK